MNRVLLLGVTLTVLGIAGYGYGLVVAFSGRAFAVTLVMVGVTLVAMRGAFGGVDA